MYAARTIAVAELRFDAFVKAAKSSSVPELYRLAKRMTKGRAETWPTTAPAHRTALPKP